jgi:3',5'-cyclic AMP phosphodiesterase CpdA
MDHVNYKAMSRIIFLLFLLVSVNSFSQKYIIYGDTRTNHDIHRKIVGQIEKEKPDAVFNTGDLVDVGIVKKQWELFMNIIAELSNDSTYYPVPGNHEMNRKNYKQAFNYLPNQAVNYVINEPDVVFLMINTCSRLDEKSKVVKWTEKQLQIYQDSSKLIVAMHHHPPYSTGPHKEDENNTRNTLIPLYEKYNVKVVFTGHDHCYERSTVNGIQYVVSGGGGAPLYDKKRSFDGSVMYKKTHHYCKMSTDKNSAKIEVVDSFHCQTNCSAHFGLTVLSSVPWITTNSG